MRHVGFYWTRPVFWAGFRQLDPSPEIAAGQSRTIRYQRALVRQWAGRVGAEIVEEVVAMEIAPDRASPALLGDLERALGIAAQKAARLVLVDFADAHGWRRHGPLWDRMAHEDHALISPEPLDLETLAGPAQAEALNRARRADVMPALRPERLLDRNGRPEELPIPLAATCASSRAPSRRDPYPRRSNDPLQ
ncbi:hypothetical protein [Cereibacter sphaeroides]|uniref:hypothetical protein n=1 Tax=Cereibacter sphaeroides TaxID=1063 RepID=UPI0002E68A82|nr:hypothetical protein [Cereibacter sphaeroides]